MAVAVRALDDASRALGIVVAVVASLGVLEQVAEDEEDGADEEREGLHADGRVFETGFSKKTAVDVFFISLFFAFLDLAAKTDAGDEKSALSMRCVHS